MAKVFYLHIKATELNGLPIDKAILKMRYQLKDKGFQLSENGLKILTNLKKRNFDGQIDGSRCVRLWVNDGIIFQQYARG